MMAEDPFHMERHKPTIVGTGLVALDVILNGESQTVPQMRAGGSCGNVLTILSSLGWKSLPVASLEDDEPSEVLLEDMKTWGVDTSLITTDSAGRTPIVVERIKKGVRRGPVHHFTWTCPTCGSFLPRYRPVLARMTPDIIDEMKTPEVFYFDRVSRSAIELAQACREKGSLVFFEPTGIRNRKQFKEGLSLSHIVKYSYENKEYARGNFRKIEVPLRIETLGSKGLRFRLGGISTESVKWKSIPGYETSELIDTAGAGDWCSAGILHLLGRIGEKGLDTSKEEEIEKALEFGQAMAVASCLFEGARGIMYALSSKEHRAMVKEILSRGRLENSTTEERNNEETDETTHYCLKCKKSEAIESQ